VNIPSNKQQGFTLIEIIVVVVIIGILATFVAPKFMGKDNFTYPTTDQGLDALINQPTADPIPGNWQKGGYLKKLQKDPWGREYLYLSPGEHGEIDIFSYGADGVEGGEGSGSDIGNWQ